MMTGKFLTNCHFKNMNIQDVNKKDIDLVQRFLDTKPDNVVIYKGFIKSDILIKRMIVPEDPYSKLDQYSDYIDDYYQSDRDVREFWKSNPDAFLIDDDVATIDDIASRKLYRILKIKYLLKSIRENGVFAPFVALNDNQEKYAIHPGSDRMIVMDLLCRQGIVLDVPIYWIWYKELYPNSPLHEDMENFEEITTVEQFFEQFVNQDYNANEFFDMTVTISSDSVECTSSCDVWDDTVPLRTFKHEIMQQWNDEKIPSVVQLQWLNWVPNLDKTILANDSTAAENVYFKDENTFLLGDEMTFVKVYHHDQTRWYPDFVAKDLKK